MKIKEYKQNTKQLSAFIKQCRDFRGVFVSKSLMYNYKTGQHDWVEAEYASKPHLRDNIDQITTGLYKVFN